MRVLLLIQILLLSFSSFCQMKELRWCETVTWLGAAFDVYGVTTRFYAQPLIKIDRQAGHF